MLMSDGVAKEWEFITPTSVCTPCYTIAFPHPFFTNKHLITLLTRYWLT